MTRLFLAAIILMLALAQGLVPSRAQGVQDVGTPVDRVADDVADEYWANDRQPSLQQNPPEEGAWPMAGANPQRTSWTSEEVRGQLRPEWYLPIEPFISNKTQVIAANGLLYISTSAGLYAIDAENGDVAWVYPTDMPLGQAPTVVGSTLYVGGYDRAIHAISALPDLATLPSQNGYRVNDQLIWRFDQADAGFETNPLVVDGTLYAGNRDGNLYAMSADTGALLWKFGTGGPILFSAAHYDHPTTASLDRIYFASNDSYAYAVDPAGNLVWKSAKLPGAGFHSWWPVVNGEYVVFSGSNMYAHDNDTFGTNFLQNTYDRIALYNSEDPEGTLVGPVGEEPGAWASGTTTINDEKAAEYLGAMPWRRAYFVLDANTGTEMVFDTDDDGQQEYAPVTWAGTHSGNRYPPAVGPDGVYYQQNSYSKYPWIPRGHVSGWKTGTSFISMITDRTNAIDEPMAYSVGGSVLYYINCWDRTGGAIDVSLPLSSPEDREWMYFDYTLQNLVPGYWYETYSTLSGWREVPGAYGGTEGLYTLHGANNPFVPYRGRVYRIAANTVMAFGTGETGGALPLAAALEAPNLSLPQPSTESLRSILADEVQKMLDAGHLRPGYHSVGIGDIIAFRREHSCIGQYYHNPGETFVTLIDALPYLPEEMRPAVRSYIQDEYNACGQYVHTGWQDGAAREVFDLPPELEAARDKFSPRTEIEGSTWDARYGVYGLYRYAQEFGGAADILSQVRHRITVQPPEEDVAPENYGPHMMNAYIAGYIGYLGLQDLAGEVASAEIEAELDRLLAQRTDELIAEEMFPNQWEYRNVLNVADDFLYMVPELAEHIRQHGYADAAVMLQELERVAPYWFVAKYDSGYGETTLGTILEIPALFQAKAHILDESYDDLVKYLDVPAFARGDLFYIQNLVAALEAAGTTDPTDPEGGPTISGIELVTASPISTYGKIEVGFDLDTVATNPYFPYDANTPVGVETGTGVAVDMLVLSPGESNWANAQVVPAFYHQPVEEVGVGSQAALLPVGAADWRARFSTGVAGTWQFKIRATDASGTTTSDSGQFMIVEGDSRGYVKVSETDSRMFEFSDGTPFTAPLVTAYGDLFGNLSTAREYLPALGENGVRFMRWFPTGESGLPLLAPYGDAINNAWHFGAAYNSTLYPDTETGHQFSFCPYYYTVQSVPIVPGETYRLTFRARVRGDWVLRAELGDLGYLDIGSADGTYHENNGNGDSCDYRQEGWHSYAITATNTSATDLGVAMRGLYATSDGPAPYNNVKEGSIRINSVVLQRDETGNGDWGANLLVRSDPDTYNYIDQRASAMMDYVFELSEEHDVYHKVTMFHKNDAILNRMLPDGTNTDAWDGMNVPFYSAEGLRARWYENAYTRYFMARWGYSTSLHSVELANENHLTSESYQAGWDFADLVHEVAPRDVMVSNSFWGWFVGDFFDDAANGHKIDYADKHWYANVVETNQELISNTWDDSAEYVREAWRSFDSIRASLDYDKPIMRGECGVAETSTQPQHPEIKLDATGTYYHKKMWAHVGSPQYALDGEWYPHLTDTPLEGQWPNPARGTMDIYAAYGRYIQGEPINNGYYTNIGTDLAGDAEILLSDYSGEMRAWGVRDAVNGRVLLWVDNAGHTWKRVVDGEAIAPASADLVLQGLPEGSYTLERWDTTAGSLSSSEMVSVEANGELMLAIDGLAGDVAFKLVIDGAPAPTSTPEPTATQTEQPTATFTPTAGPTQPTNSDLTQGLVGYWPLDGGAAQDMSESGNHGTLSGPTSTDGYLDDALNFDGVNDYVDVADSPSLDIAGNVSIAAWIKPSAVGQSAASRVLSKRRQSGGSDVYALGLWNNSTKPFFRLITDASSDLISSVTIPLNDWSHVVAVFDGSAMRIYINGVETDAMAKTGAIDTSDIALHLGDRTDEATDRRYAGGMDEVMLWNRALGASEVQDLFQHGLVEPVPPTATPTATNTPVPPTATPTATNTPVPPTATPTATNTPVAPTATPTATNTPATPTATPTATNTPVPPTATPTLTTVRVFGVAPSQGPQAGGTMLTIDGQGFGAGASVTLGGKPCANVAVVSASQINCVSPDYHAAESVDVMVTNLDGATDTLVDGYTYIANRPTMLLSSAKAGLDEPATVTLSGQALDGVVAADLIITYDETILSAASVTPLSALAGWSVQPNLSIPGQVLVAMASGGAALSGAADLLEIEFTVVDASQSSTNVALGQASLNDGGIACDTVDTTVSIDPKRSVSGSVTYWSQGAPVANASIALVDGQSVAVTSDADGIYSLDTGSSTGCRLTADKAGDIEAISAYDAALVLQHAAALINLDGAAFLAADVNNSGSVSAMDGYYILQKAVDAISLPFPGSDRIWRFTPGDYTFAAITQNLSGRDFTGVLVGDVSGNWGGALGAPMETGANLTLSHGEPSISGPLWLDLRMVVGETPISSLDLVVTYDPGAMALVEVSTDGVGSVGQWLQHESDPGRMRLAFASGEPISEDGLLARFGFEVCQGAPPAAVKVSALADEGAVVIAPTDCLVSGSARPDRSVR